MAIFSTKSKLPASPVPIASRASKFLMEGGGVIWASSESFKFTGNWKWYHLTQHTWPIGVYQGTGNYAILYWATGRKSPMLPTPHAHVVRNPAVGWPNDLVGISQSIIKLYKVIESEQIKNAECLIIPVVLTHYYLPRMTDMIQPTKLLCNSTECSA